MHIRDAFFHYFPTPRFLIMPAAGLDISDHSVRFAELVQKDGHLELGRYGERSLPEGVVVAGEIKQPAALKTVLSRLRDELRLGFVHVSLSEQQSYLVKMRIPRAAEREVRETVLLQLEGYVPLSPKNAVFDYHIVTCDKEANRSASPTMDVGVAVLPQKVAAQYSGLFRDAGLVPRSFELEAHALQRALLPPDDCGTHMIVDIGATRSGVSIVSEGIVRHTSTIRIGGNQLTDAVARAFRIDRDSARRLKEQHGLSRTRAEYDLFAVLAPIVSALRDEVHRRYLYWHTHADTKDSEERKKVECIIMCGGEANVPGLVEYFAASMHVAVSRGNPWSNIRLSPNYVPALPYNRSLRYVTALGLALRSFQ